MTCARRSAALGAWSRRGVRALDGFERSSGRRGRGAGCRTRGRRHRGGAGNAALFAAGCKGSRPRAPADAELNAARRRSLARAIVERHAAYSAVGGHHPGADRECRRHHRRYRAHGEGAERSLRRAVRARPRARDRDRADGGRHAHRARGGHASTLVYIMPGSNLIGLAVSSLAASRLHPRHRPRFSSSTSRAERH